ncbi:hypothetical protein ACFWN2_02690 [Lentzea sp. NPDC058436]
MTSRSANDLFSHPETHESDARHRPGDLDRSAWADLFQEPGPAPATPSSA